MVASHSMSAALGNIEPSPPVGSVVWNNYVRILDEDGSPVTDGDIGEIYIGGAGVALGYTDTYLTSNRFVPDPYHPATRLHRSRDRGCWTPDGKLSFQGRIDDLIKIRGFRVEPREVESHIICCPGVERVAVFGAARPDAGLELNAVITGRPPSGAELRRRLLGELPDYMVPVRWWLADSLPISPNGKLDRISLPGRDAVPLPMLS
jgi:acyl-CoA synthetase (AMP-forming)/AMP-acid ligase II